MRLKNVGPLPAGWTKPTLETVCEIAAGNPAPQGDQYFIGGKYPFVRVQDMGRLGESAHIRNVADKVNDLAISKLRLFPKGAVLFTKSGASTLNNQRALLSDNAYVVSHIGVAIPHRGVLSEWVYYFLKCTDFGDLAHSSVMPSLPLSKITPLSIPIPPFKEQLRIVAKIEELFSELDKGIESLKTAQAQLKVYRQSLLKHAFEGKLTAQWRADNPDKLETAEALLERIQRERVERYQQQVADWEAANQSGGKPKSPKPLPPPTAEELTELPELPTNWAYTYLAELGDLGRGKSKHRPRNDPRLFGGRYPFLQTGEVKAANRVIREYSNTYSDFGLQQSKLWPTGTLCITIAANIAETAFLGFDACFPDSVVGFSAFKKLVLPEYVDFFLQAVRTRIEAYAPATAQKNINLETLENLVVPLCGVHEQQEILSILEERFSVADQLDETITTSMQKAEALRQSILKKAFSGQLAPQDPTDEPAAALLARIRAEREKTASKKSGRSR